MRYSWHTVLGRAVDEIYLLRGELAREHQRVKVDLDYKTFPKSRRDVAQYAQAEMQKLARGELPTVRGSWTQMWLKHVGASPTLTFHEWAASNGLDTAAFEDLLRTDSGEMRTEPVPVVGCQEALNQGAFAQRCGIGSSFVLWGNTFPESGRGPRCADHAALYMLGRIPDRTEMEQWAVIDLRGLRRRVD